MKKISRSSFRRIRMGFLLRRIGSLFTEEKSVLFGIGLVLAIGLALEMNAVGIDHIVEKWLDHEAIPTELLWLTGGCFLLAFLLSSVFWVLRDAFLKLQVRAHVESSSKPKSYLVFFVSPQKILLNSDNVPKEGAIKVGPVALERKSPKNDADLLDKSAFWKWTPVLRGIDPHMRELKRIYLLGSEGEKGSFAQLPILKNFLLAYLVPGKSATATGADHMVVIWPERMDFEDFEDVHKNLEDLHDQLEEEGIKDNELCVDITGGQKPNSAAAGLFSVKSDIVIQYVQTNEPKEARMHDVRLLDWPEKTE